MSAAVWTRRRLSSSNPPSAAMATAPTIAIRHRATRATTLPRRTAGLRDSRTSMSETPPGQPPLVTLSPSGEEGNKRGPVARLIGHGHCRAGTERDRAHEEQLGRPPVRDGDR